MSVMSVKGEGPLKELARCEHSWHDLSTFVHAQSTLNYAALRPLGSLSDECVEELCQFLRMHSL